jgi:hypothetical protein
LREDLENSDNAVFGYQGLSDIRSAAMTALALKASQTDVETVTGADAESMLNVVDDVTTTQGGFLADSDTAVQTKASASPIDEFRDRVAFREEIRAAIIENQLDDVHDLYGNILYLS